MEKKAFDLKALVAKLKDKGLDIAEDMAVHVVEATFDWVEEGVVATPNPYDDLALTVTPVIKKMVLSQIDKLDGKQDLDV